MAREEEHLVRLGKFSNDVEHASSVIRIEVRGGVVDHDREGNLGLADPRETDREEQLLGRRPTEFADPVVLPVRSGRSKLQILQVTAQLDPVVLPGDLAEDRTCVVDERVELEFELEWDEDADSTGDLTIE